MISRIGNLAAGLMKKKIAVLDLGRRFIKLIVIEKRGQNLRTIGADCIALPVPEEGKGEISDEALFAVLAEIVRKYRLKRSPVVSSLPRQLVTVKMLELPPAEPDKIKPMLEFEAERYIPYPLDRVYYDFQVFSQQPGENVKLLLVAVRKPILHRHLSLLEKAGLKPKLVDVDCFAGFNALRRDERFSGGAVAYLDIGAVSSELVVAVQGIPRFSHSIAVGSDDFTDAIKKGLETDWRTAEEKKLTRACAWMEATPDDSELVLVAELIRPVLDKFAGEIRGAFDYFRRHPEGKEIGQMVLSGGGALLPRLDHFFTLKLGVSVVIGEPNRIGLRRFSPDENAVAPAQFSVALGMAMRETSHPLVTINLIPTEIVQEGIRRQQRERKTVFALAGAGGILLAVIILFFSQLFVLNTRLKEINGKLARLRPEMEIIRHLKEEKQNMQSGIDMVTEFTRKNISWMDILRELTVITPKEVWFTSLEFGREGKVEISGESLTNASVQQLETALKNSSYFTEVKLLSMEAGGRNTVTFRLTCQLAAVTARGGN